MQNLANPMLVESGYSGFTTMYRTPEGGIRQINHVLTMPPNTGAPCESYIVHENALHLQHAYEEACKNAGRADGPDGVFATPGVPDGVIYAYTKDDAVRDGQQVAIADFPRPLKFVAINGQRMMFDVPPTAVIFVTDSVWPALDESDDVATLAGQIMAADMPDPDGGTGLCVCTHPKHGELWLAISDEVYAGSLRLCLTIMRPEDY